MEHAEDCVQRWQDVAVHLRGSCPNAQLILLTARGSERVAVDALRAGVHDYLTLPVNTSSLVDALTRCVAAASNSSSGTCDAQSHTETMVGDSELMMQIRSYMSRAAAADCTVLITGETGTGKELAAEYIHQHSPRREKPLVCINCAAIPEQLLESELFGHARGAFTGAENQCDGLLASAKGGTVFLDEIGDMSLAAQAKILRVLEKKEVSQVGGTQRQKIDIRFLAATNQDLERMSIHGTFRRDLFYRLNVARVELPPLRERREDIPLLVNHYCSRLGGTGAVKFSEDCLRQLLRYDWPGNIRELKNVVESVLLAETRAYIDSEHLPQRLRANIVERCALPVDERERLVNALCSVQWNKSRAAEKLELSRMTLYRKMARYGIGPDGPRRLRQTSEV
jgi:DNA-binding NtrC family response regulator